MKTMLSPKSLLLVALMLLFSLSDTHAQLEVRLSIKVVLDANGNRPAGGTLSTDAGIQTSVDDANRALASFGRGFQFRITEITNLSGHAELLDLTCQDASDSIDAGVAANPTSYRWRNNAVNVYINKGDDNSSCAFNSLLVMKYTAGSGTFLHEGGHHLGLCHTQGCGCKTCPECPTIESDNIDDTLPDRECWELDDIATNSFGKVYANLTAAQQMMVSNTFNNIMSYHKASQGSTKDVLTSDQWDLIADYTRTNRANVMNGKTVFVDNTTPACSSRDGFSECFSASVGGPFLTVTQGITRASSGDIVLIRPGNYNERTTITKAITLRATRGNALIGKP
jgi:hypothetical protein